MKEKSQKESKNKKKKEDKKIISDELLESFGVVVCGIIFFLMGFLCLLPVTFDFTSAKTVGKVLMISGSVAFLLILILLIYFLEKVNKDDKKNKLFRIGSYIFSFVVYIISLLNYFDKTLWGYNDLIWGSIIAIVILFGFYSIVRDMFGKQLNSEFKPMLLIALALLTLFIAAGNYETNKVNAILYFKIAIGFCYLVGVALYVYRYLYTKEKGTVKISGIISTIFWAALILISFPFYVQWWGLDDNTFSTFVTVYSAVVGGGLTLAGVAWTITNADNQRKDEERKKFKPLFNFVSRNLFQGIDNTRLTYIYGSKLVNSDNNASKESQLESFIENFDMENSSKIEFFVCGIYINNVFYKTHTKELIKKNHTIRFDFDQVCFNIDTINEIKLSVEDLIENQYTMELEFSISNHIVTITGNKSLQFVEKTNE